MWHLLHKKSLCGDIQSTTSYHLTAVSWFCRQRRKWPLSVVKPLFLSSDHTFFEYCLLHMEITLVHYFSKLWDLVSANKRLFCLGFTPWSASFSKLGCRWIILLRKHNKTGNFCLINTYLEYFQIQYHLHATNKASVMYYGQACHVIEEHLYGENLLTGLVVPRE